MPMTQVSTATSFLRERGIIAILMIGAGGELGLYIAPFVMGALVDQFQAPDWMVSWIMSVQFTCIAVASLAVSFFSSRLNLKSVLFFTVSLMLLGNLISAITGSLPVIVFGRGLTGLGEGGTMACAYALAARSADPDRAFSVMMIVETMLAMVFLISLPFIVGNLGVSGTFVIMVGIAVCLFPFVFRIATDQATPSDTGAEVSTKPFAVLRGDGLALFFGFAVLSAGSESIWLFLERIGQNIGLTLEEISFYAILGLFAAILGPVLVFIIGNRFGRTLPFAIAIGVLMVSGFIHTHAGSLGSYFGSMIVQSTFILFMVPFLRALMAQVDSTGELAAASSAAFWIGNAVGPAICGFVLLWVGGEGYGAVGRFAVVAYGLAVTLIYPVTRRIDRLKSQGS